MLFPLLEQRLRGKHSERLRCLHFVVGVTVWELVSTDGIAVVT